MIVITKLFHVVVLGVRKLNMKDSLLEHCSFTNV